MNHFTRKAQGHVSAALMAAVFVSMLAVPNMLFAQSFAGADTKVCGFFDNIKGLLNMASIAIVTIAILFCGYQIAFNNKRITDVLPILLGGVFIGAAGQIAKMLVGDTGQSCSGSGGGMAMVAHAASTLFTA